MAIKEEFENTKSKIKEKVDEKITQEDIMKVLDTCYQKCVNGAGKVIVSVDDMAKDYLEKNSNPEDAAKSMQKFQIAKCTTSGFVNGFGGIITMPVTVPANISSVLYVQMRMIACTAKIAGYDLKSDQVQTLVYACLAGIGLNEVFKGFGIKFGEKIAVATIKKIPGSVLTKINQKVGFRLLTKFGEKGLINLGKLVPGVGAIINGTLDLAETKIVADRAFKMFFKGELTGEVDAEEIEIDDSNAKEIETIEESAE